MTLILDPRQGLGDNIYGRPFVRAWSAVRDDVVVRTPWPQLFADLPVATQMVGGTALRTQKKSIARTNPSAWTAPAYIPETKTRLFVYSLRTPGRTILQEIESIAEWPAGQPFVMDLPTFDAPVIDAAKPIAVVRPVTLRNEWPNRARNPNPDYVSRAASMLRAEGYHVVVVGDCDWRHEPLVEPMPTGDTMFTKGELSVEPLLGLIQRASVVVGGVGWIVPACMAYGTPAVIIGGGNGAHNAPELVTDPRVDCSRMRFILPDHYCRCSNMRHGCNKVIRGFDARFMDALGDVTQRAERAA